MVHGSSVNRGFKGMRKGISLVEMLIAVVLFGVISTIGYKYYKNFYNTTLAAKQARISAIIDQATQISNAYDLYVAKIGAVPTLITDLSDVDVKILTETPTKIPEISATGWAIKTNSALDDAVLDDVTFSYVTDGTASAADKLEYCNILNNIEIPTTSLDTLLAGIKTETLTYADGFTKMMCYTPDAGTTLYLSFVKTVN